MIVYEFDYYKTNSLEIRSFKTRADLIQYKYQSRAKKEKE